jgi:hypothetical protein
LTKIIYRIINETASFSNTFLKQLWHDYFTLAENRVSDSEEVSGDLSKCSKHGNTAMLELSSSVPEDLLLANTSGQPKRIKLRVFNISANKPL